MGIEHNREIFRRKVVGRREESAEWGQKDDDQQQGIWGV